MFMNIMSFGLMWWITLREDLYYVLWKFFRPPMVVIECGLSAEGGKSNRMFITSTFDCFFVVCLSSEEAGLAYSVDK